MFSKQHDFREDIYPLPLLKPN